MVDDPTAQFQNFKFQTRISYLRAASFSGQKEGYVRQKASGRQPSPGSQSVSKGTNLPPEGAQVTKRKPPRTNVNPHQSLASPLLPTPDLPTPPLFRRRNSSPPYRGTNTTPTPPRLSPTAATSTPTTPTSTTTATSSRPWWSTGAATRRPTAFPARWRTTSSRRGPRSSAGLRREEEQGVAASTMETTGPCSPGPRRSSSAPRCARRSPSPASAPGTASPRGSA
jgi:hypothetical protein